jgi:hypothetical protein
MGLLAETSEQEASCTAPDIQTGGTGVRFTPCASAAHNIVGLLCFGPHSHHDPELLWAWRYDSGAREAVAGALSACERREA